MAQGIKSNISKECLEELLKEHTLVEIAEILHVSLTTIKRYKNKYGLEINQELVKQRNSEKHAQYSCDISYFDKIDTMSKAYLLGFLCADGFITDRNEIGIGIQKDDIDIIKFFQAELKSNKPIKEKDKCFELRIQNSILADKIQEYGIVPNKSLILDINKVISNAKLNDNQIRAFLLGYFDGDGGIYYYNPEKGTPQWSMSITGTLETCNYYLNYFNKIGFLTKRNKDDKNNYTYQIGGCNLVFQALSELYSIKDNIDFYYIRKYNKFKELQEYIKRG